MEESASRFQLVEICIVLNRNCSHFVTFQVLATGLSALYSDLPTSLDIPSEDWYSLERGLWATFPELVSFLTSLEFCNNVVQVCNSFMGSRDSETVGDIICRSCGNHLVGNSFGKCIKEVIFC